jgi:hypothetical protein
MPRKDTTERRSRRLSSQSKDAKEEEDQPEYVQVERDQSKVSTNLPSSRPAKPVRALEKLPTTDGHLEHSGMWPFTHGHQLFCVLPLPLCSKCLPVVSGFSSALTGLAGWSDGWIDWSMTDLERSFYLVETIRLVFSLSSRPFGLWQGDRA